MNILYVADTTIAPGGAAYEHIGAICRPMRRAGHKVTLLCQAVDADWDTLGVDEALVIRKGSSAGRGLRLVLTARSALRQKTFDFAYLRYRPLQMGLLALPSFRAIPRFLELNGIPEAEMRVSKTKRLLVLAAEVLLEHEFFRSSHGVIAVSRQIAAHYQQRYALPPYRVVTLNNGVRLDKFIPKRRVRTDGPVRLGFVGSLQWWQGLDIVLKALAHPDMRERVELLIVGSGPEMQRLTRLATELRITNVSFVGHVDAREVPGIMAGLDIGLVSKSIRGEETSPLKLFEYWAAGLPVLATNLPGLDLVCRVQGGLLYECDDVSSFVNTLRHMLANRDRWSVWGANGRAYVEQFASWDRIGDETLAFIYRQLSTHHDEE